MKTIKLLSFIIILFGPVITGSVWAAARSGGGNTGGSEHHAAGNQHAGGGSQLSGGQPYISGLQIARRGGRGGARGGGGRSGARSGGRGGARSSGRSVNRSRNISNSRSFRGGQSFSRNTNYGSYQDAPDSFSQMYLSSQQCKST